MSTRQQPIQIISLALGLFCCSVAHGISKQDYVSLLAGSICNISDVTKLFPKSVDDVKQRQEFVVDEIKKRLKIFLSLQDSERTFENTALVYDRMCRISDVTQNSFWAIAEVHPKKEVRDSCRAAMLELKTFFGEIVLKQEMYKVFKSCISPDGLFAGKFLDEEKAYFIQEAMKRFRRIGLHLPAEELENVRALSCEIDEICSEFNKNIAEHGKFIVVSREELAGVDESYIDVLEQKENGLYIVPCTFPSRSMILDHCSVESTREKFYWAWTNRTYPENEAVLQKLVAKRDKLAHLTGFPSFAHYNLEGQMARKPEVAEKFLRDLADKVLEKADKEREERYSDLPPDIHLNKYGDIDPWNGSYADKWRSKKKFSYDALEVKKYFPLKKILPKIFGIFEQFLGLSFKIHSPEGFWHKDVIPVAIYKKDSPSPEGYIIFDLHPREKTYEGVCLLVSTSVRDVQGNPEGPSVILVSAILPGPTKGKPALLSHDDVASTLFHELGHAMHCILGRTLTHKGSGYGWPLVCDYGEFPSQLFEQWPWDKEIMKMISEHYKTGDPLPDDLIDTTIALKKDGVGGWVKRLSHWSLFALASFNADQEKDFQAIDRKLHEELQFHFHFNERSHWYTSSSHSSWYGARCYSYLYSLVFAHDVFERIKKDGLLHSEVGAVLIEKVLSKGVSIDPMGVLQDFLGREPCQEAYFKNIGVLEGQ